MESYHILITNKHMSSRLGIRQFWSISQYYIETLTDISILHCSSIVTIVSTNCRMNRHSWIYFEIWINFEMWMKPRCYSIHEMILQTLLSSCHRRHRRQCRQCRRSHYSYYYFQKLFEIKTNLLTIRASEWIQVMSTCSDILAQHVTLDFHTNYSLVRETSHTQTLRNEHSWLMIAPRFLEQKL